MVTTPQSKPSDSTPPDISPTVFPHIFAASGLELAQILFLDIFFEILSFLLLRKNLLISQDRSVANIAE